MLLQKLVTVSILFQDMVGWPSLGHRQMGRDRFWSKICHWERTKGLRKHPKGRVEDRSQHSLPSNDRHLNRKEG